jgi:glutamine synthetase
MASFVERFGLWTDEQKEAARELVRRIDQDSLATVRFAFPDQHGILRGKTLVAEEAKSVLESGVNLTSTLLAKDSSHRTVFPIFTEGGGFEFEGMQGGADFVTVADPTTFKVLPWASDTGWVLCDAYMPDGRPCPLATRSILKRAADQADQLGFTYITGLEVEFHVFRVDDRRLALEDSGQPGEPPKVSLLTHGHQYLTELRYDQVDGLMTLLRKNI